MSNLLRCFSVGATHVTPFSVGHSTRYASCKPISASVARMVLASGVYGCRGPSGGGVNSSVKVTNKYKFVHPLYALYVEHLHDMLRADAELEGLKLPGGRQLKSSAFADDTRAVTATTHASVRALRKQVGTFEKFAGARMNWHKTVALLPDLTAAPLFEGMHVQPMTEAASNLGIELPQTLTDGSQMEQLMRKAATRLALCGKTLDAGIFGRVLLANTAASAMLWYAAPVSTPSPVPQREYRMALSKFVWKNDPFAPHAIHRVAWRKLIQPKVGWGLGLIDPATQIQVLQLRTVIWLLLERDDAPWTILTLQTMAEAARLHPADMELALMQPAILTELKRGTLWSPFLQAWRSLAPLELNLPSSMDQILQQPLFDNPRIRDNGEPFPWAGPRGAFGKAWLKVGVARIADLWDLQTDDWQPETALLQQLAGQTHKRERLHQIQWAIPEEWLGALRTRQRFDKEWVALRFDDQTCLLFQGMARVGELWLIAEAWENPPSEAALGRPLVRSPRRDGWVPRDLVRSVSVVTDRKGLPRVTHQAFRPKKRPAQLAVDPAMWHWRKQGLQHHGLPLHQVSTKAIYRSLTTPYRIDQELQCRWACKGWLTGASPPQWSLAGWKSMASFLQSRPNVKHAGLLWLNIHLALPTNQWLAKRSSFSDGRWPHCDAECEDAPHVWSGCPPQQQFWTWWRQEVGGDIETMTPEEWADCLLIGPALRDPPIRGQRAYAIEIIRAAFLAAVWALRTQLIFQQRPPTFAALRAMCLASPNGHCGR
ncbi:hypothetical protein CBR_g24015 [Chara braunii]|uniref:Reverse transcriptase domain-containing protein n=1 Tax=Chara braunii TaxID=69332 RepID=A0A388L5M6_CHABU|nr:hypothetical protein CBR_g24015 [Chara braunii]|eukprot:GBG77568.1 hypothetical protein CBR_g24015 [Chara braunii]